MMRKHKNYRSKIENKQRKMRMGRILFKSHQSKWKCSNKFLRNCWKKRLILESSLSKTKLPHSNPKLLLSMRQFLTLWDKFRPLASNKILNPNLPPRCLPLKEPPLTSSNKNNLHLQQRCHHLTDSQLLVFKKNWKISNNHQQNIVINNNNNSNKIKLVLQRKSQLVIAMMSRIVCTNQELHLQPESNRRPPKPETAWIKSKWKRTIPPLVAINEVCITDETHAMKLM